MRAECDSPESDTLEHQDSEVLTVDELAEMLRLDRKTVYHAIARGEIPGVRRIGRSIRISRTAIVNWLGDEGRDDSSSQSWRKP